MIVDGYIRISQLNGREGESFISPAVQREQIEEWTGSRGAAIATIFEEYEESGARDDRPLLMKALERIESGLTDGLVVATLDRFGRSLLGGLAAIERIQRAGGSFASVGDGFDLDTDTGKLVSRIMLAIGEWELDRIRGHWSTARERAVQRGVHMGRCAPVGYSHTSTRRLRTDPVLAPAVAEVYRRRAAGATLAELSHFLNESGVPALSPRWQPNMLRRMLANRVYVGELHSGQSVHLKSHQPLVSHELWQAAQRQPAAGARSAPRQPAVLSGILRCAGCRMAMSARTVSRGEGRETRVYACNGESVAGACRSQATVQGSVAEPLLDAMHFMILRADERRAAGDPTLQALNAQLHDACLETARFRDSEVKRSAKRLVAGIARRSATEQRLRLAIEAHRARLGLTARASAEECEERWPQMSVRERRASMRETVGTAFVLRGRDLPEQRVLVCADDAGELPERGKIAETIVPADLTALVLAPCPLVDAAPAWSASRIGRELRSFLDDAQRWPADDQFVYAGRGPLLRQCERSGGAPRWTRELGIDSKRLPFRHHYWTDARVRMTLAFLLQTRSSLPTRRELLALGYAGLASAVERRGRAAWAAEFSVDCGDRRATGRAAATRRTQTVPQQRRAAVTAARRLPP